MFALKLNDMRFSNCERLEIIVRAETVAELEAFLARERVPSYVEKYDRTFTHITDFQATLAGGPVDEVQSGYRYCKSFRKGGLLEWYNPPYGSNDCFVDIGTREDWIKKAVEDYERVLAGIPTIPETDYKFNCPPLCSKCGKLHPVMEAC